ncbi:MAG: sensor histidine kinase, partial [Pseudomonadota bacterium]|nr:sensor histidine kinase [Pseudomonadota bacterium]
MKRIEQLRRAVAGPWVPVERGKSPYLWILMLAFLLWKYLIVAPTGVELALLGATILVFVPLYFASYWCRGWQRALVIGLTCLIG